MHPAPPLSRVGSFPVTGAVAFAAAGVTLAYWSGFDVGFAFLDARGLFAEPWRLFTCVLLHGSLLHLAFNLLWLWILGSFLEERLKSAAMLGCVLVFAVGSSAAQYAFSGPGIGLSGVVYGLAAMLYAAGRRDPRFAGGVDAQTVKLFVIWFFLCIVLTAFGIWNIGNVAHGSGAVLGAALGVAVARPSSAHDRTVARLAALATAVLVVFSLVAAWLRPPLTFDG